MKHQINIRSRQQETKNPFEEFIFVSNDNEDYYDFLYKSLMELDNKNYECRLPYKIEKV